MDPAQNEQQESAHKNEQANPATIPDKPPSKNQNNQPNDKKEWTKDPPMFFATVAGVLVVAVYTTVSAWQAVLIKESNEINKDTLIANNRAYIYFLSANVDSYIITSKHSKLWQITIGIGNSGNTPTDGLRYNVGCVQSTDEIESFFTKPPTWQFMLGPKVVIDPYVCTHDSPDTSAKMANVFYVTAVATYHDIFGNGPHITEACYRMDFNVEISGTSNHIAFVGPCQTVRNHNCADDQCKTKN